MFPIQNGKLTTGVIYGLTVLVSLKSYERTSKGDVIEVSFDMPKGECLIFKGSVAELSQMLGSEVQIIIE